MHNDQATIVIVPGLRDHVEDHWQTHLHHQLQRAGRRVVTVPPLEADKLSCSARVEAIQKTMQGIAGTVVVVAHSGGVVMLLHWAQQYQRPIRGALLAAPPDFEAPLPAGYPTMESLDVNGWLPVPRARLPFPSVVAASSNDPLARLERVEQLAQMWGSELVHMGAVGHLNPASGFGPWPQAQAYIDTLDQDV